eukprot:2774782-Pleurochrysis_carterae.AAC.1
MYRRSVVILWTQNTIRTANNNADVAQNRSKTPEATQKAFSEGDEHKIGVLEPVAFGIDLVINSKVSPRWLPQELISSRTYFLHFVTR